MHLKHLTLLAYILPAVLAGVIPRTIDAGVHAEGTVSANRDHDNDGTIFDLVAGVANDVVGAIFGA
ncbi:hypothetical protein PM082_006705 [Marasmius tenuissimus]|nr:hypothetical protein PM082_006705 [Marasmius tenuissimus]